MLKQILRRGCRSLFIWAYEDVYLEPTRKLPWYSMLTLQIANFIGYPRQAFCRLCNPVFFNRIGCSDDYQPLQEVRLILTPFDCAKQMRKAYDVILGDARGFFSKQFRDCLIKYLHYS